MVEALLVVVELVGILVVVEMEALLTLGIKVQRPRQV
jgi:hypothetical protein